MLLFYRVIDQALRDLSVLIEQRKASESEPPGTE